MIRGLLISLAAAGLSLGAAQAADFEVPIDLAKGATIDLVIEKSREDVRKGATTRTQSVSRYRQIVTPSAEGFRIKQTLTGMEGGPAGALATDEVAAATDLSYDADEALTPVRVLDWPAAVDRMIGMLKKASPTMPAEGADGARKMFLAMSPEQAASVMLKEQNFLALPQMASLDLGKPISVDEPLANPLGGPPIDSTFTVELRSVDAKGGRAVIHTRQALDPTSAMASMRKTFETMAASAGRPAPTQAEIADLRMERTTTCVYDMDLKTGLTAKADCASKNVVSGGGETATRGERWVITQTLVSQP